MSVTSEEKAPSQNTPKDIIVKILVGLISVGAMVGFDQWTKFLARKNLPGNPYVLWENVFELRYTENTGAAWGILHNNTTLLTCVSIVIFLAVLVLYMKMKWTKHMAPLHVLCLFIMGGAIGNMIDRIYFHFVTDFLYIKLINFPIFNVADVFVTFSTVIFCLLIITKYRNDDFMQDKKEIKENADGESDSE